MAVTSQQRGALGYAQGTGGGCDVDTRAVPSWRREQDFVQGTGGGSAASTRAASVGPKKAQDGARSMVAGGGVAMIAVLSQHVMARASVSHMVEACPWHHSIALHRVINSTPHHLHIRASSFIYPSHSITSPSSRLTTNPNPNPISNPTPYTNL